MKDWENNKAREESAYRRPCAVSEGACRLSSETWGLCRGDRVFSYRSRDIGQERLAWCGGEAVFQSVEAEEGISHKWSRLTEQTVLKKSPHGEPGALERCFLCPPWAPGGSIIWEGQLGMAADLTATHGTQLDSGILLRKFRVEAFFSWVFCFIFLFF